MNTAKQLSTLGHGARHTNRDASAEHNRAIGRANYAAAQTGDVPVLITELRAHGHFARACRAAGIDNSALQKWRKRDPALDKAVRLAVKFAASDAVDYAAWVVQL